MHAMSLGSTTNRFWVVHHFQPPALPEIADCQNHQGNNERKTRDAGAYKEGAVLVDESQKMPAGGHFDSLKGVVCPEHKRWSIVHRRMP
jgi:hypothetical protein